MKLISRNDLREILFAQTKATIVSIVSCIEPDLKKTGADGSLNPFMAGLKLDDGLTVCKVNKAGGRVDTDYQKEVINQAAREIQAERALNNLPPLDKDELQRQAEARPTFGTSWHEPVLAEDGRVTALSRHKKDNGTEYLRIIVAAQGDEAEYLRNADGVSVSSETVELYDKPKSPPKNQGLDKPKQPRTYKLASIVEIRINGEVYRVADNFMDKTENLRRAIWDIAEAYMIGEKSMHNV